MRKLIFLMLFLLSFSASAQDSPEVINAANISRLQSVAQIDFADLDAEFDTGMFWMNDFGNRLIWGTSDGRIASLSDSQLYIDPVNNEYTGTRNLLAFDFDKIHDFVVSLYQYDESIFIAASRAEISGFPLDIWTNDDFGIFVETIDEFGRTYLWEYRMNPNTLIMEDTVLGQFPLLQNTDDVVRIGRIPLPYIVTSTLDGHVRLRSIECFECDDFILYEVDNGTGQPSVFGAINLPPTHLVWRDNANESLYLLNFETGENRLIDELNGDYAQWFFLSPDASVILAVNLGFEPNIVAWDVATGERTVLGEYRQCNRPQPDMARLSADGTTLVIGCDTGLDIWRIVN